MEEEGIYHLQIYIYSHLSKYIMHIVSDVG